MEHTLALDHYVWAQVSSAVQNERVTGGRG
jgi:hypothetical protein